MSDAIPMPQPPEAQPFAVWNPTRGVWETSQPDLYGHLAPYSETWPTSGTTHDGSAYPLPHSARGGETLDHVKARRGTIALSHQVIDLVTTRKHRSPEETFALIEDYFDAGDATQELSLGGSASPDDPPQPPPS